MARRHVIKIIHNYEIMCYGVSSKDNQCYLVQQVEIADTDKLFSDEIESNYFPKLLVHSFESGSGVLADCKQRIPQEGQKVARPWRKVWRVLAAMDQLVEEDQEDDEQDEVPHSGPKFQNQNSGRVELKG